MNKNNNTYLWLMLVVAAMVTTGCPAGEEEHDHDHDHDAGMHEHEHDGGMEMHEDHDAGMEEETMDAGMEEVDDCTAAEAGEEMTDDATDMDWTCAPQEDEAMCFNSEYDWEARCANESCVQNGELCFRHNDSLWYNECLEANSITEYCDNVSNHVVGADSVVIYSIAYVETVAGVASFIADLYSDSADIESLNQYSALRFVSASGTESGVNDVPTLTAGSSTGHYTLEFALGGTAADGQYAIFYDNGAKSNAYCFTNAEMPTDAWTLANNNNLGDLYEASDDCGGEEEMTETDGGVAEATEADAGM
jgi:hypothetical protein